MDPSNHKGLFKREVRGSKAEGDGTPEAKIGMKHFKDGGRKGLRASKCKMPLKARN